MKHKFNIGDKVKIVQEITVAGVCLDEVFEIQSFENAITLGNKPLYNIGLPYLFCEEQLESIESIPFTKSELKDGMVVEYSNGERKLVIGNKLYGHTEWDGLNNYDINLINTEVPELSINKIYKWLGYCLDVIFEDKYLELIWERKPIKEMTISEIEEELGYKIKVIQED